MMSHKIMPGSCPEATSCDGMLNLASTPELPVTKYQAAALEALRRHELLAVLSRLAGARVMPILMKGTALAYSLYAQPEDRPRSDTDLLIKYSDLRTTTDVLTDLGYKAFATAHGKDLSHQQLYQRRAGDVVHSLDVHWKISNPLIFADLLTYDEIVANALPVPLLGPNAFSPSVIHSLLIACIHRIAHHASEERQEWIHDIHLLFTALSIGDRRMFIKVARAKQLSIVCVDALQRAISDYETAIESFLIDELNQSDLKQEPSAVFLNPHFNRLDLIRSNLKTLSPIRKLQLVFDLLFPSPQYLRSKYPGSPAFALPFLYVRRIYSGVKKHFSL